MCVCVRKYKHRVDINMNTKPVVMFQYGMVKYQTSQTFITLNHAGLPESVFPWLALALISLACLALPLDPGWSRASKTASIDHT